MIKKAVLTTQTAANRQMLRVTAQVRIRETVLAATLVTTAKVQGIPTPSFTIEFVSTNNFL